MNLYLLFSLLHHLACLFVFLHLIWHMVVTDWVMPIDGYWLVMLLINYHHFDKLAMYEESSSRLKVDDDVHEEVVPAYRSTGLWNNNTSKGMLLLMYVLLNTNSCVTCSLWFWICVVYRFLAIPWSKKGKRKLGNRKSLYPK